MHWFVAALLIPLLRLTDSFVGRVLIALGLGFVSYQGIDTSLDWVLSVVTDNLVNVDGTVAGIMGVLRIDQIVTILLSAVAVRIGLNGMAEGARRLVAK